MGCASSKPSKDKKDSSSNKKLNKKTKSNDAIQAPAAKLEPATVHPEPQESPIHLDKNLIDQIKKNEVQVIEYIVKIVQKELNNELTRHATRHTTSSHSPDLASTTIAVKNQKENDDLIVDVSSKAINQIVNTPLPNTTLTYKSLNLTLRTWPFICKNQANKIAICDLTTETIRDCLNAINEEIKENSKFELVSFLNQNSILTPPASPVKEYSQEDIWNETAVLMNRTKANQIARLLFLSNKARPFIHPSNRIKDAYFVNRELPNKTQVTITQHEIDEILNNSTYKNNPHIMPVTPRKLDMNSDLLPRQNSSPKSTDEQLTEADADPDVDEDTIKVVSESSVRAINATVITDESASNLMADEDFCKVECVNLTVTTEKAPQDEQVEVVDAEEEQTQTSEDTNQTALEEVSSPTTQEVNQPAVKEVSVAATEENNVPSEATATETEQQSTSDAPKVESVEPSNDTNVIDQSETCLPTSQDSGLLEEIVSKINDDIQTSVSEKSEDTEKLVTDSSAATPPSTPEVNVNGLAQLAHEIISFEANSDSTNIEHKSDSSEDKTYDEVNGEVVAETAEVSADINAADLNTNNSNSNDVTNDSHASLDDGNLEPSLKQSLLDDRFYNNDGFKNGPPVNGNDAENDAATKIQATFKGEAVRGQNEESTNGAQ